MALAMVQRVGGTFNFPTNDNPTTLTQLGETILEADTTSAPVTINLPNIATYFGGQLSFRIKIVDWGNNAGTNNITINAASGNTIDGGASQMVINTNGAIIEFILTGTTKLSMLVTTPVVTGANAATIYRTSTVITSAQILTLNATAVTIVAAQGSGTVIKPIAIVSSIDFNTVAYGAAGAITTAYYGTTNTGVSLWDTNFITNNKDDIYDASYSSLIASGTASGWDTYNNQPLRAFSSAPITLGNSNVRVNTYWIAIKGPN